MVAFVDPRDRAQNFRENRVKSILDGSSTKRDISIGQPEALSDDGSARRNADFTTRLNDSTSSSSSQHSAYLQAVKRKNQLDEEARQAQFWKDASNNLGQKYVPGASYSFGGGAGASRGGLTGQWNLVGGADAGLRGLQEAYKAQFGSYLPILEGGRTYERQAQLYNLYKSGRGNLAARPGTSNHETGRSIDIGGAARQVGSAQHNWLVKNGGNWGWGWEGKNFGESWHFTWYG